MVEHLALGRSSRGQLLITRALPDAVQAGVYFFRNCLRDGAPAEEFAGALAGFARQIISSGLFHPDFHCGNVLYLPERHKFALVDVYGVRKAFLFDRFQLFRMERILMELRQALDRGTMLRLLSREGVSAPETFYLRALRREARRLFHEWPRRRRQILAGYPKFTRAEGPLLRVVDPAGAPADETSGEPVQGDAETLERLLLAHFFLQLACIPHRPALLLDRKRNLLFRARRQSSRCRLAGFRWRLAGAPGGIRTEIPAGGVGFRPLRKTGAPEFSTGNSSCVRSRACWQKLFPRR